STPNAHLLLVTASGGGVEMVTGWLSHGDEGGDGGCGVGTQERVARGGEWCGGSSRSGEEEYFLVSAGILTGKVFQRRRLWPAMAGGCWKNMREKRSQIPDKGDISAYWLGISSAGDFLGTSPSYTLIRDLMLRLYHRLIACSIAGRSQTPKKVLEVVRFREKAGAMISGGQFVARLAEHFRLITEERL
nr:hypothetical protein [Tanacetum cinerariifolium]GEY11916.1 hypothetical protein [Tanacetum cinerariifolium]